MKGVYTAHVDKIIVLGRMNDVNVQIDMKLEYAEGVSGIDVVNDITAKWHAAGLEPPVRQSSSPRTYAEKVSGSNGRHPDDLKIYFFPNSTDPAKCPNCAQPLYYVDGIVKKFGSEKFGEKWVKWYCPEKIGGCGAYNFDGERRARFDKK